jgi:hypothetical protein
MPEHAVAPGSGVEKVGQPQTVTLTAQKKKNYFFCRGRGKGESSTDGGMRFAHVPYGSTSLIKPLALVSLLALSRRAARRPL